MAGDNPFNENTTAWLSTTGSQIFFMQLGFLCYEAGFVESVWTQSIILKNIEDTFVGVLTFLAFGYTLSESEHSFYGIISIPTNPFLIGVNAHKHDQILISAFFASTCATIMSGAILERMKNKVYILWCLLIIILNYSFVSHWVWHPDGWLSKLGFVDGAGAIVVHSTAGMAALVAIWRLGPRKQSIDTNGCLVEGQHASRPIIHATGAFFLWYGWFAFNVASPIAFSRGIGDAIGTTALVTIISPICSSCGAFILMFAGFVDLSFEHLLSCLLAGLVVITGPCHTCNVWEASIIGFMSSVIYFVMAHVVRHKWHIDDPMQVISIHLCCGIFSCFIEGVVANDVYGTPGLIYGGFKHFLVQLLGVSVIALFNFIVTIFLYDILLARIIFSKCDIRVSILDIYLGTRLFDQNYNMALHQVLNCQSNTGKKMLCQFHKYIEERFASEQLDFLIVVKIFNNYLSSIQNKKYKFKNNQNEIKITKFILQIIDSYIEEVGIQTINISGTQRSILLKIKKELLLTIETKKNGENNNKLGMDITKEHIFDATFVSVWKIILPHFAQFLLYSFEAETKNRFEIKIPFKLNEKWILKWDEILIKQHEIIQLKDMVPHERDSEILLNQKRDSMVCYPETNQIEFELYKVRNENNVIGVVIE